MVPSRDLLLGLLVALVFACVGSPLIEGRSPFEFAPRAWAENWKCPSAIDSCGNEALCDDSTTYFCEDWEDQGFEGWDAGSRNDCSTGDRPICDHTPGAGSTSYAKKFRCQANSDDCAFITNSIPGLRCDSSPCFWRHYTYFDSVHTFYNHLDGAKNQYLTSHDGSTYRWITLLVSYCNDNLTGCLDGQPRDYGMLQVSTDFHHYWVPNKVGVWTTDHDCTLRRGEWKLVEVELKCAQTSSQTCSGSECGHINIWLDGTLCHELVNLSGNSETQPNLPDGGGDPCWRDTPTPAAYGHLPLNFLHTTPWMGGGEMPHPETWISYDQMVLASTRVFGVGETETPGSEGAGVQLGKVTPLEDMVITQWRMLTEDVKPPELPRNVHRYWLPDEDIDVFLWATWKLIEAESG